MKRHVLFVLSSVSAFLATPSAFAASVLDSEMSSAVTTALGDLKDTIADLVGVALPIVVAVTVIVAVPMIVKRLIKMASKG